MKYSSGTNIRESPEGVKRRDALNKYSSGANIRESPVGVKRWDALNKNGGTMGRFSTATRPQGWGKYDSKDGGARAKQEDRAERNAEGSCRVESA